MTHKGANFEVFHVPRRVIWHAALSFACLRCSTPQVHGARPCGCRIRQ